MLSGKFILYKILGLLVVVCIVLTGFLFNKSQSKKGGERSIAFSSRGTIIIENNNGDIQTPLFAYRNAYGNQATSTLEFDTESICAVPQGTLVCFAMSMSYDAAFDGKQAYIEGIRKDNTILIRKLQVL